MSGATGQEVERFSAVQVYVHFLMALAILLLFISGAAITFGGHIGWLIAIVGYGNIVLVHIIAGVTLFVTLLYYAFYALTGLATGDIPTDWLPDRDTISEVLAYAKYVLGKGEEPKAGKYNWIQKSEILIIMVELTVLTLTGLVLTFPGLLLRYKPAFLAAGDLHVVFAFTLLMGVTFHLYDTHVLQFPLDRSMFTGRVSLERARDEWAGWVDADPAETETAVEPADRAIQVAGVLVVLFVFAAVYSGVMIDRIFAPIPGTQKSLYLLERPETILEGSLGLFWGVGLNVAMLVMIAGLIGLLYGITLRISS